jgi:nucleoside phosphorylase
MSSFRLDRKSLVPVVLLVTALDEEAAALREVLEHSAFRRKRSAHVEELPHHIFRWGGDPSEAFDVIVVAAPEMGKVEAAVVTTRACLCFRPQFVFLIGIAGGFRQVGGHQARNPMNLGDILIANQIVDIDLRKIYAPRAVSVRQRVLKIRDSALRLAHGASHLDWDLNVPAHYRHRYAYSKRGSNGPRVHFGPMVCGDGVFASEDRTHLDQMAARLLNNEIRSQFHHHEQQSPIGVEMEGTGVQLAVERSGLRNCNFLMIKAASDFADGAKSADEFDGRKLAQFNSASFAVEIMKMQEFSKAVRAADNSHS